MVRSHAVISWLVAGAVALNAVAASVALGAGCCCAEGRSAARATAEEAAAEQASCCAHEETDQAAAPDGDEPSPAEDGCCCVLACGCLCKLPVGAVIAPRVSPAPPVLPGEPLRLADAVDDASCDCLTPPPKATVQF